MSDTLELTRLLGTKFIQRKDVKAWQQADGAWFPERKPMSLQDFEDHLAGTKTMGHYMVDQDDECKLFAFDIDLVGYNEAFQGSCEGKYPGCTETGTHKHGWMHKGEELWLRDEWLKPDSPFKERLTVHLRCLSEGLALRIASPKGLDIPVAIAVSGGKGLHVYGFTGSLPASAVRKAAISILDDFGCFEPSRGQNFYRHITEYKTLEIEIFPKQDSLDGKDLGNLMKLPLGINRKTGIRSEFITCKTGYNGLHAMDPERAMDGDLPWE